MSQVNWGKKPADKKVVAQAANLDSLVMGQKGVQTRRLNLNIPASLHTRIKAQCAIEGRDMTEALIKILEADTPRERLIYSFTQMSI